MIEQRFNEKLTCSECLPSSELWLTSSPSNSILCSELLKILPLTTTSGPVLGLIEGWVKVRIWSSLIPYQSWQLTNSNFISSHHYLPWTVVANGNSRTNDKAPESLYFILGLYMVILLPPQFDFILCLKNKASCRQSHLWGWTAAFWSTAQIHSMGPMLLIKVASVSQHLPITCCKSPSELFPQSCKAHLFFGDTWG